MERVARSWMMILWVHGAPQPSCKALPGIHRRDFAKQISMLDGLAAEVAEEVMIVEKVQFRFHTPWKLDVDAALSAFDSQPGLQIHFLAQSSEVVMGLKSRRYSGLAIHMHLATLYLGCLEGSTVGEVVTETHLHWLLAKKLSFSIPWEGIQTCICPLLRCDSRCTARLVIGGLSRATAHGTPVLWIIGNTVARSLSGCH
jgi:hypothetical protein